ncbi:hypothetical protein CABS01_16576 [Colletotrichum abscissum]|uniref:Uncharacterized protein n=1 Tax=Colletotrichum limetticola TaxID=1209924 RepID=A0ABQ9PBA7_9PEZI|nr:uncharacterized protein CABS01_16576 [Colletotrichum abscissum]KAK0367681.1 hypothetical protein CLIM01_14963 [Colletotrichum limetticola]KAK1519791.1 hypothetical protein CABS01_16576 [Colletotrichum abscissum]
MNRRSWTWILDNFRRSFIHSQHKRVFIFDNDVLELPLAPATDWIENSLTRYGYRASPAGAETTVRQRWMPQMCLLPPPSAYLVLENVQFVTIDDLSRLCPHNTSSCDTASEDITGSLHRLPRLRAVTADLARKTISESATDFRPIQDALPELSTWADELGSRFAAIWRPLQEKGVKLYLRDPTTKQPFSEIVVKEQALMVRGVSTPLKLTAV